MLNNLKANDVKTIGASHGATDYGGQLLTHTTKVSDDHLRLLNERL